MKTVFVLIDHPNLDYLHVPVIEEILKSGQTKVIPCVCNAGEKELFDSKKIHYTTDIGSFNGFLSSPGKKLLLNAVDTNHPAHRLGRKLDEACRELGIPSLSVEHAAFSVYGNIRSELLGNADRTALSGSFEYDEFLLKGIPPEKLIITGSPKYDVYYDLLKKKNNGEKQNLLRSNGKKGYILLGGANHGPVRMSRSHSEAQWTDVLKNIFEVLIKKYDDLDIIVKPHPAEPYNDTVKLYENAIKPEYKSKIKIIDSHGSLPHAILGSEFVISFSPSVMLDSLLLQKPAVLFCDSSNLFPIIEECKDIGAIFVEPEWPEIHKVLSKGLPDGLNEDIKKIHLSDEFIKKVVHKWDGKASNRIAYLIDNMIEDQPVRLRNGILVDWQGGHNELQRYSKADLKSKSPENWYQDIQRKVNCGRHEDALLELNKLVKEYPDFQPAYIQLGMLSFQRGIQKSMQNFEKAMNIDSEKKDAVRAVLNLCKVFIALDDRNKARNIYLSYLAKYPYNKEIINAWGLLKDKVEDKEPVEIIRAEEKDYLVSAIVSTYKSEDFMGECLENLESQTISEKLEIVVVDAASPQKEGEIVREFIKRYSNITYIRTKARIGVYSAWNIAIKASHGKYCISVSTNDALRIDACEILASELDKNSKCALVYGDTFLTKKPHETFETNSHYGSYQWPPFSFEDLLKECMVGPHPMWRRSIHENIGYFDERYIADGDQEFWLRIGEKYNINHLPEFTGLQWITQDALSRKGITPHLEGEQIRALYQKRHVKQLKKERRKCSVIIPVFNKLGYTKQCLTSLFENTSEGLCEIIVINNGSTDGTEEYLRSLEKEIVVLTNKENSGFSKACNQGAHAASCDSLLFLNNDTEVMNGWIEPLIEILSNDPGVAAVGSKMLFPDNTIQHAGVIIFNDKKLPDPLVARHIHYMSSADLSSANELRTYQALTAACVLVRRSAFEEVGGFDEAYWNGYEDVDLCFKLQKCGWSLVYQPKSVVVHYESKSGPERFRRVKQNIERLHSKWLGKITPDFVIEKNGVVHETAAGKIHMYVSKNLSSEHSNKLSGSHRPRVSIVTLTFNQLEYTKKFLESLSAYTPESYEIIIVDNGSTDGTVNYLTNYESNHENVKVIINNKNLGFAAGNNQGIARAEGDYIVLMNNDVVVTQGWLGKMISCAERFPNAGIVGPMTNYVPGQQLVKDVTYDTKKLYGLNWFSNEYAKRHLNNAQRVLRVVGFCMLVKRAVIEKIGGLDHRYGLGNFEDDDFSLRAALCGFESWIAKDCFVHHFGSRTFIGAGINYNESLEKNWQIFKEKWKMPRDLPYGSYNLSQIGRKDFDQTLDRIPLNDKDRLGDSEDACRQGNEIEAEKTDAIILTSIIISTENHKKHLRSCLESIKNHTVEPYELIFVDNGSGKSVLKWLRPILKKNHNYRLIKCQKGIGLATCYNEGIKSSSGEVIVVMHNDLVVSDGWLSGMLECIKKDSEVGIVGPMTNNTHGIQRDFGAEYPSVDTFNEYACRFRDRNRHRKVTTKNLSCFCIAFRRDFIEKNGLFDKDFETEKYMFEDLFLRARLVGYKNVVAADVFLHHYDIHNVIEKDIHALTAKDRNLFTEKVRNLANSEPLQTKLRIISAMEKADDLWQRDQLRDAVSIYKELLKQFPDEKLIYDTVSEMLIEAGYFEDALEVLEKMSTGEGDMRKLELFGYCKEGMGDYHGAEEYADRALSASPGSVKVLNLKGILAFRKNNKKDAERFFKKAVALDPSYGEPYANLGYMRWAEGHKNESMDLFEKGFVLNPTITDIFKNYHGAVKALEKYNTAEPFFHDACRLYPFNKRLKYLYIDILVQQGKLVEAMNEIEGALIDFGMDDGIISAALAVRNQLFRHDINKASMKKNSVSLCMIVKDEEQTLGKCLKSVKPVVDEMIVVDTGSTDRTKEMANIFGARVYDFEWTNDFSEARNYSISKAAGDWILVMDADETISPLDYDSLKKLVKQSSSMSVSYSFVTRNYNMRTDIIGMNSNDGKYQDEEAGVGWVSSEKVRMFRNGRQIRFEYPVHEVVEPCLRREGIEIRKCGIPVHHYGQLNNNARAAKGEQYYLMGMQKLDEIGDNVKAIYELAVQAGMLEKWEDAVGLWQKLIVLRPHFPAAYVNMGTALQKLGKYDEAILSIKKAMALDPDMKEAPNDYGLYRLYQGYAERAIPVLEGLVKEHPDYLSAQFKLAAAYVCGGRKEDGLAIFDEIGRTPMGPGLSFSFLTIAEELISLQQFDYARAVLEAAVESKNDNREILSLLKDYQLSKPSNTFVQEKKVSGIHAVNPSI